MLKNLNRYYFLLAGFIVLYISAILVIPPDPAVLERLNLTVSQLRLISFSVYVPYIIIWVMAFYGFIRFKQYTQVISDTTDGRPLETLANGHMILAFGLPISALASTYSSYAERHLPSLLPAATIIENYIALGFALAGFILIARGANDLVANLKKKPNFKRGRLWTAGFVALAAIYSYMILQNPVRQFSSGPGHEAVYFLPDPLIILTIILPYLYMWYLGIRAAALINFYKQNVGGQIYKPFLGSLVVGIAWVIASSIMLQFLAALSEAMGRLSLRPLLLLVYVLLICIAIGYVKIALGAKQLKKIEDV